LAVEPLRAGRLTLSSEVAGTETDLTETRSGGNVQRRENYLYVGIDLHKRTHTAVLINCWNEKLDTIEIENKPSEFKKLADKVNRNANQLGLAPIYGSKYSDSFLSLDGVPMYKTGDMGYWDSKSRLIYSGRKDDQIKINAMRVELGEIEYELRRINGILDVSVLYIGNKIISFIQVEGEFNPLLTKIELSARLPSYMIPYRFIPLKQLPRNRNGKVDKHKLKIILGD